MRGIAREPTRNMPGDLVDLGPGHDMTHDIVYNKARWLTLCHSYYSAKYGLCLKGHRAMA